MPASRPPNFFIRTPQNEGKTSVRGEENGIIKKGYSMSNLVRGYLSPSPRSHNLGIFSPNAGISLGLPIEVKCAGLREIFRPYEQLAGRSPTTDVRGASSPARQRGVKKRNGG